MSAQATSVNNQSGRVIEQLFAGAERDLLEPDTIPTARSEGFALISLPGPPFVWFSLMDEHR